MAFLWCAACPYILRNHLFIDPMHSCVYLTAASTRLHRFHFSLNFFFWGAAAQRTNAAALFTETMQLCSYLCAKKNDKKNGREKEEKNTHTIRRNMHAKHSSRKSSKIILTRVRRWPTFLPTVFNVNLSGRARAHSR